MDNSLRETTSPTEHWKNEYLKMKKLYESLQERHEVLLDELEFKDTQIAALEQVQSERHPEDNPFMQFLPKSEAGTSTPTAEPAVNVADFVALEKHSDWGYYYYAEKGKGLTEHGTADTKLGLPFRAGHQVRVLLEDGTPSTVTLVKQKHTENVYDTQPKPDKVTSFFFGFNLSVHGSEVFVDLTRVRIHRDDLPARRK